ncbi:hypothetical protein VTL71DRAFT_7625 [Oculimacula yallundae]|uniref:Uncharacterized protein n=1 Tax=Oculimacula yallundae TaxID=86028 RepID=A0ABR4BVG8_9HELO
MSVKPPHTRARQVSEANQATKGRKTSIVSETLRHFSNTGRSRRRSGIGSVSLRPRQRQNRTSKRSLFPPFLPSSFARISISTAFLLLNSRLRGLTVGRSKEYSLYLNRNLLDL